MEKFIKRWNPKIVKGNGCALDMKTFDLEDDKLVAKPTGWATDSDIMADKVGIKCSNLSGEISTFEDVSYGRKTFYMPDNAKAPKWELVTRRTTFGLESGETSQDLKNFQAASNEEIFGTFPSSLGSGRRNIRVRLFWREGGKPYHAHGCLLSGKAKHAAVYHPSW